jgi:glycosyltransferase involved in cell wall biosynthesis
MNLFFLIPGDIHSLTGGYLYNLRIIEGLEKIGYSVNFLSVPETFSQKEETEMSCRDQFLQLENKSIVILDSLILGLIHKLIKEFNNRIQFLGLIHLPLSFPHPGINKEYKLADYEMESMQHVSHLIVTGRYMKDWLERAGIQADKISVVEPGVDSFPEKRVYSELPRELLCIANYSEMKGQLLLLKALKILTGRRWILRLYGDRKMNPDYVAKLDSFIKNENLEDRIFINDSLQRNEISRAFLQADLFILPSYFESFGMALTESLAHGIPVLTSTAGNIPFTVPASMALFFEPGSSDDLAETLDKLLTDSKKYQSLCVAASKYHADALSWESAAEKFEQVIRRINQS